MKQEVFNLETYKAAEESYSVYSLRMIREREFPYGGKSFSDSKDVYNFLKNYLRIHEEPEEVFILIALDTKHKIIGVHTMARGAINSAIVHPREVFKRLLANNASAFICAHNHPSQNPHPSPEDRAMTSNLVEAGKLLGIKLLDHLIACESEFYSFADNDAIY